jgi:arylsulfatase A-like enzyme
MTQTRSATVQCLPVGKGWRVVRAFFVLVVGTLWTVPVLGAGGAAAQGSGRPNVVIILTDDHRATDTMQVMPETMRLFGSEGVQYTNAFATTPICCPARAGIMTGRFNHNNGVLTNADKDLLAQDSTIQRYLHDAGYRTGITGKYLNGYDATDGTPPHFDRFSVITQSANTDNYTTTTFWEEPGQEETVTEYSTDHIADKAVEFIDDWESDDPQRPWFLYMAPFAPHEPTVAEPDYQGTDVGTWAGNPAVFEKDRSDKPQSVAKAPPKKLADGQEIRGRQLRTLLSVDDLVERVFQRIQAAGDLNDTLAFFLGDNGYLWAEHGRLGKGLPYTQSIQVPFFARWPGKLPAGTTDTRFVANIDLAPTIMEAAGIVPAPQHPVDGTSLLQPMARSKILTEFWDRADRVSGWASIRTTRYQYVEWYSSTGAVRFRELYVLANDPWQLTNVLGDDKPKNDSDVGGLAAELLAAKACSGASCVAALTSGVALCAGNERRVADHLVGTEGADRLVGGRGADLACGFGGNDRVRTGPGRDELLGGGGRDVLRGGGGRDRLHGERGKDQLKGQGGKDRLRGGPGTDRCSGGSGRDRASSCEIRTTVP